MVKDSEARPHSRPTESNLPGGGGRSGARPQLFVKLPGDSKCSELFPASLARPHRGLQTHLPAFVHSGIKLSLH